MNKKLISLITIMGLFALLLAGCGKADESIPPTNAPQQSSELSPASEESSEPSSPAQGGSSHNATTKPEPKDGGQTDKKAIPTLQIQVGSKSFTTTLYDNDSTRALLEKLPLTLSMDEMNGNEKYYFFSEKFPSDSQQVDKIKAGDLMLYGSDCLVLFFKDFSTSYSYTRLGHIEDTAELTEALGSGSVQVTFSTK